MLPLMRSFSSLLRLMMNIHTSPFTKCRSLHRKIQKLQKKIPGLQLCSYFWHNSRAFDMMKYLLLPTFLILFLFRPSQAQEAHIPSTPNADFRPAVVLAASGTNYLNRLALRGFSLDSQGVLIESLDGRTMYADLNSNVGFSPASVIKVATSFAALAKLGPEYHFETSFYADGTLNKKTRSLDGDLILV